MVDRGHVVYDEKTVADLNKDFPDDDRVVKLRVSGEDDKVRYFPVSRIALDSNHVSINLGDFLFLIFDGVFN